MKAQIIFLFAVLMVTCLASSSKRKRMMTGGWSDVKNLESPDLLRYAKFATVGLVAEINSPHHLRLMNVTKAQQQVVAGMNYKIHMAIGPTTCLKSENLTQEQIEECPLQPCDHPLLCSAKVWVQAWQKEDPIKVSEGKCQPGESFC